MGQDGKDRWERFNVAARKRPSRGVAAGVASLTVALLLLWQGRGGGLETVSSLPEEPSVVVSSGTFARGETLAGALQRASLSSADAAAVSASLRKKFSPRSLREGDPWTLVLSTAGVFRDLTIVRGLTEYHVEASSDGTHRVFSSDVELLRREGRAAGTLQSTLWESMIAAQVPPALIAEFSEVFAWQVDFNVDPREGDAFSLLWEEQTDALGRVQGRKILAASYEGAQSGRKAAALFEGDYYDENDHSLRRAFLSAPLAFRRISSKFTHKRFHPILRYVRPHLGIDYAAPTGTPVKTIGDGTVIFVGRKGGFGRYIEVRHNATYTTCYGHLSRFARGLKRGNVVRQGAVIGYVGATGIATGPHLDFRVRQNNRYVNFLALKMPPSKSVPQSRRAEFDETSAVLFGRLAGTERLASVKDASPK